MRYWLRGKRGGLLGFLAVAALVAGGLGWATAAALRLEREQLAAQAQAELSDRLRLALWRLDSLLSPVLAKEDSRPYDHYSAIYAPAVALRSNGTPWPGGAVLEPSPLLSAELPAWMQLHFQVDAQGGWASPQVLSPALAQRLAAAHLPAPLRNVTPERRQLLLDLEGHLQGASLLARLQPDASRPAQQEVTLLPGNPALAQKAGPSQAAGPGLDSEYANRASVQSQTRQNPSAPQRYEADVATANTIGNGVNWLAPNSLRPRRGQSVSVTLGPMIPLWLSAADASERLVVARRVQIGSRVLCQGILLDWPRLREFLGQQVSTEFPRAVFTPLREAVPPHPERTMTALPVEFDPGSVTLDAPAGGWTPLRVGLALAWAAALVALLAVGLGGWSLLDLSERRIRFVSAVTHELRTPLTTLRLYLDMLAGGMVTDPKQKEEYIQTLNAEADRLHRLVGNVLDFSRLENQRPRLVKTRAALDEVLGQVYATWEGRCRSVGKELVLENHRGGERLWTDVEMVQQILGNLIDNACKYSQGAEDRRIWLRARSGGRQPLALEVEDRGPGVPPRERRTIFRPFRRGERTDVTAGGAGLGLALARRWAGLLGGNLRVRPGEGGRGACFRLELPAARNQER